MIPAPNNMTHVDSLPGEEIEFSIGDPRFVMRTQADLYSNRELAVAREYSTNAYDANRERALRLGIDTEPIEVSLPTTMKPYFVVRDFGDGMSHNIMAHVYTKFGTSTKRDSNMYNGMLGYGCKSAVAYTDQFTVTSIHEGVKTIAVVTRKPDWSITMKFVSQSKTDERSGTEIVVPVHNPQEFAHKARDFYAFWLPGRVKLDGAEPDHFVGDKITDGMYHSNQFGRSYIVMGNVPYRIENAPALFRNSKISNLNFVAYVENGDVEFTPSREDLMYTDLTKQTLHKIISDFEAKIVETAQADIDAATTHVEAYKAWSKWVNTLGRRMFSDLEFDGDVFRSDFKISAMRYDTAGYRGGTYRVGSWNVESMDATMVITDYSLTLTSRHKQMAKEYITQQGWKMPRYVLFSSDSSSEIKSPWIERDRFVKWEDLKAALPKKPRVTQPRAGGRAAGSFDYFTLSGREYEKYIPLDQKNLYYVTVHSEKTYDVRQILRLLDDKDAIVVILGANRLKKFKRDYPQAKDFLVEAGTKVVKDGPSLLSDETKEALSITESTRNWLMKLDTSRVNDEKLKRLSKVVRSYKPEGMEAYDNNLTLARHLKMWYNVNTYEPKSRYEITTAYPLLRHVALWSGIPEHTYLYINAVCAAETEKKNG